jgi:sec-independent protein translocase protein TatB
MFEIGFWEMVMVGVVALIVVGPERLPGLARTAGLWIGKARRMFAEVKADVDRELHLEEIKQSLRQSADLNPLQEVADQVKAIQKDLQAEFDDPGPPPGWQPDQINAPPPPGWIPPDSVPVPTTLSLQKPEIVPPPVAVSAPPEPAFAAPLPSAPIETPCPTPITNNPSSAI